MVNINIGHAFLQTLVLVTIVGTSWSSTMEKFTREITIPQQQWNTEVTNTLMTIQSKIECAGFCLAQPLESCNAFSFDKVQGCMIAKLSFVLTAVSSDVPAVVGHG